MTYARRKGSERQQQVVHICPHCGYDITPDAPISKAGFEMPPYGDCSFNGVPLNLTPSERAILYSILKADGDPVSRAVLAERIGYDGDGSNIVDVFLTRIRAKIRATGFDYPLENIYAVGVRLSA